MSLLAKIIFGLIGIGFGVIVSIKAEWLMYQAGRIGFAEKYLGTYGGTRLFYQILGVLIIAIATLWMTGGLESLGDWVLRTFFGANV